VFIDKYVPGANISDANLVYGYAAAQTTIQVLKQCGDNLTRENVMKQAAGLRDFAPDTLVCTENLIRVDDVMDSPKLAE
jgi:branched-chain amino acid transport system substrate-binding protein